MAAAQLPVGAAREGEGGGGATRIQGKEEESVLEDCSQEGEKWDLVMDPWLTSVAVS